MDDPSWQSELERLGEAMPPSSAQAWFTDLSAAPPSGADLRGEWRRALLRLAALHRVIDPSGLSGESPRVSMQGAALQLEAQAGGLEMRDLQDAETALFAGLDSLETEAWLEAAAIAERGRDQWDWALADDLQARVVQQLVGHGEIDQARALLPRVRWRHCTVEAIATLWPHGDDAQREAWLAHADTVIADSCLPQVYSVEPFADLVVLSGSPERLARLEASVADLEEAELEPSQDYDDPRISLARARQACGQEEKAWALFVDREPGWLHWHAALTLAQRASDQMRTTLLDHAWATLHVWAEAWSGQVVETLKLDPDRGAADVLAWLSTALRRGDDDLDAMADLLGILPDAPRQDAIQLIADHLPHLDGGALIAAVEGLIAFGFREDRLEEARGRVWAEAPDIDDDPWWWRETAALLPAAAHDTVAERLMEGLDQASQQTIQKDLGDGLLALYRAMDPSSRDRWRDALVTRCALLDDADLPGDLRAAIPDTSRTQMRSARRVEHGRFHDRLALQGLLADLGWTLPRSILAPRLDSLAHFLPGGTETAERMVARAWDAPLAPLNPGGEAMACRTTWARLLTRPGLVTPAGRMVWRATPWLVALAMRLSGLKMGAALLDDALAWASTALGQ